jgi:hypothetical protein
LRDRFLYLMRVVLFRRQISKYHKVECDTRLCALADEENRSLVKQKPSFSFNFKETIFSSPFHINSNKVKMLPHSSHENFFPTLAHFVIFLPRLAFLHFSVSPLLLFLSNPHFLLRDYIKKLLLAIFKEFKSQWGGYIHYFASCCHPCSKKQKHLSNGPSF